MTTPSSGPSGFYGGQGETKGWISTQHRERSHMTSAAEGGGGFEMLTVADKGGGGGLSLADVSKNTKMLAKIVSNQACLTLCVRLLH